MKKRPDDDAAMSREIDFSGGIRGKYADPYRQGVSIRETSTADPIAAYLPSTSSDALAKQLRALEAGNQRIAQALAGLAGPCSLLEQLRRASEHFEMVHDNYVAGVASSLSALTTASSASTLASIGKTFESSLASMTRPLSLTTQMEALNRQFETLARPPLQASILAARLATLSVPFPKIKGLSELQSLTTIFADSAAATMKAIGQEAELFRSLPEWLQQAPSIEQYAAGRALAVVAGSEPDLLAEHADPQAEAILERVGDELETRLASVHPTFVQPYRGAYSALTDRRPDWPRHVATSLRELVDHLLRELAPDSDLATYFPEPGDLFYDGEFTRKAQLKFIFRNVAVAEYEIMANKDIDLTLATFYPANATVHTLVSPLTSQQVMVFWRRVQGCLSTVLEAAGY